LEWLINKTQQSHAQTSKAKEKLSQSSDNQSARNLNNASNQNKKEGWTGVHHLLYQGQDMKNWILLDNKSTTTISATWTWSKTFATSRMNYLTL
jgi:hypothetical protein